MMCLFIYFTGVLFFNLVDQSNCFLVSTIFIPVTQIHDELVHIDNTTVTSICWSNITYSTPIDWSQTALFNNHCTLRSAWYLCQYLSQQSSTATKCVIEISPALSLGVPDTSISWNSTIGELLWLNSSSSTNNNLEIEIQGNGVSISGTYANMTTTAKNLNQSRVVKWSEFPLTTSGLTATYADSIGTSSASVNICGADDMGLMLVFSSCKADGGSVSGDTYFWLYEENTDGSHILLEENDDYCSRGSYISYAIAPKTSCKTYTLDVECHYSTSGSCSANVVFHVYELPLASRFISLSNSNSSRSLDSSRLVLKNMTMSGFGASYLDGGVIYVEDSTSLSLENTTFTSNQGRNGGVILRHYDEGNTGTLQIQGCSFVGNTAGYMGGAITVSSSTVSTMSHAVNVMDCIFTNNHAGSGGAISIGTFVNDVTISSSYFTSNTAYYGGSMYIYENNTNIQLSRLTFSNDYALSTGGSIRIESYNHDISLS